MASKVDTNDPHVRRMVYNMYRGILGNYNQQANNIVSSLPKERVVEDKGVSKHVESMIRQSSQIAGNNGNTSQLASVPVHHAGPPPPPPPPMQGAAPIRLVSEIGPGKKNYEPPAAIQNAMMTKDKKPFTYTPGGLDLAEIRSPRMARRINRNAHMEDSCSGSQSKPPGLAQPHSLTPAAIAAMQPQLPVPVFPSGADSSPGRNPTSPPSYAVGGGPPPPPPLPSAGTCPPPIPPPMPDGSVTPQMQSHQSSPNQPSYRPKNGNHSPPTYLQDIQNRPALKPVSQNNLPRSPPDFVSELPCHSPLKPVNHPPRSSYEPSSAPPLQVQLKPVSPKPAPTPQNSSPPFIPQPPLVPTNQHKFQESLQPAPQTPKNIQEINSGTLQQKQNQATKPSLYIPPHQVSPPNVTPIRQTPPSSATLNKSPAPWMTSRQVQKENPPWTVKPNAPEERATPPTSGSATPITRVIPIQLEGRDPSSNYQQQMAQQMQQMQIQMHQQMQQLQQQQRQMQQMNQNMNVSYSPPITKQNNTTLPKQESPQGRTRIIPIQIESGPGDINTQQKNYTTQQSYPNQNSNSPVAQNQNRFLNSPQGESIQRTTSVDASDNRSRQSQSQVSWTQGNNNPIQSRSFRVLQKITGSEDQQPSASNNQAQIGETYLVNRVLPKNQAAVPAGADNNTDWDSNTSPTFSQGYPIPWYYPPPQTFEEQQQFWEHYNAMCAYMAHMNATAYRYSPYPFYPMYPSGYPSETEEYSGYSSSDEMAYYGQIFMNQRAQQQNSEENMLTPNTNSAANDESELFRNPDGDLKNNEQLNTLKSIKSVPNINIYNETHNPEMIGNVQLESESEEEEEDDDDDDDDDVDDESEYGSETSNHLSVIIEESEQSSDAEGYKKSRESCLYESDAASSSSTLNNNDEESENSVTVRLPLQFKISRSANDEEVTTVIVGASEVESNIQEPEETLIITDIIREDSDPEISATIRLKRNKSENNQSPVMASKDDEHNDSSVRNSESPIDFWKELVSDKDPESSSRTSNNTPGSHSQISEDDLKQEESDFHWEDDSSSTSLQTVKKGQSGSENYSGSEIEAAGTADEIEDITIQSPTERLSTEINKSLMKFEEETSDSEDKSSESEDETSESSSSSSDDVSKDFNETRSERDVVEPSDYETDPSGKYGRSKSQEESEEDDSGVTSDISRHISETDTDAECGSELQKMTRYQRAATHSRLFKLLQEECSLEDAAEESLSVKKERLMLPLNKHSPSEQDSLSSSSGINSPSSPTVTDRLVKELIQSLLTRKKGRHFRKLPMEKLYAAALRILQEDMDPYDTGSTSDDSNLFLSPVGNPYGHQQTETRKFTNTEIANPENYGANYYDYCNYYSTWGNVNNYSNEEEIDFDILPSKTFRILQENSQPESGYKTPIKGLFVRCPRVASSQNLETPKNSENNIKSPCEPAEPISSSPQET